MRDSFIRRIIKALDPRKYLAASIRITEGYGPQGQKTPPFNQRIAVDQFMSWVYIAARLNAQAVAAVPLRLYVRRRKNRTKVWQTTDRISDRRKSYLAGESGDVRLQPSQIVRQKFIEFNDDGVEEVTEPHPVMELLRTVNPYANGFDLTVLRMLYLQITGNAYIHPVMSNELNRPVSLWIMPSQWTEIIPNRETFIDGYVYGQSFVEQVRFDHDEVIHWKLPNLNDVHYGRGHVEAIWTALNLHLHKRATDLGHYENRARPDWLLVVKSGATDDQLQRFEKKIDKQLKTGRKAGRFLTVTGDSELKQLTFPDLEVGDADRVVEEIAGAFGVPISKLFANDPNRANAETGDAGWHRDAILPLCRLDEQKLNEQLLPLFGIEDDAFIAYDNPVPRDKRHALDEVTRKVASGLWTIDEGRQDDGLPPLEDGQGAIARVNGIPIDKIGENPALGAFGGFGMPAPVQMNSDDGDGASPAPAAAPISGAALLSVAKAASDMTASQFAANIKTAVDWQQAQLTDAITAVKAEIAAIKASGMTTSTPSDGGFVVDKPTREPKATLGRYAHITFKPTQEMARNARRALEVRADKPPSQRGMTSVGLARARDIANRRTLSPTTVRRMASYFARHAVDKESSTWDDQGKGWQAWHGWGGDAGQSWADARVKQMNQADREAQKTIETKGLNHKRTAVMAPIYTPETDELAWSMIEMIDEDDLADDGVEYDRHVTVKYGITSERVEDVLPLLRGVEPIEMTLGKVDRFANDDADVVFVAVASDALAALHDKLGELPNDDEHDEYQPHMTIAYLKPGKGEAFVGDDRFDGLSMIINSVVVSSSNGESVRVRLEADDDGPADDDDGDTPDDDKGGDDGDTLQPDQSATADKSSGEAGETDHSVDANSHKCTEGDGGPMPINFKGWTRKAQRGADPDTDVDEVGDADDTQREGEPQNLIDRFAADMQDALDDARAAMISRLRKMRGKTEPGKAKSKIVKIDQDDVDRVLNDSIEQMQSAIQRRITSILADIIGTGGDHAIEQLGIDQAFDVTNQDVADFIDKYAVRLADEASTTTIEKLRPQLADMAREGASNAQVIELLEQDPSGLFSSERANVIARTESARAFVEGEKVGWKQSGVVKGSRWKLAPNACEFCRAVAAQFNDKVVPLDGKYYERGTVLTGVNGGKMKLNYSDVTGPPIHPQDRCDLEPVIDRE